MRQEGQSCPQPRPSAPRRSQRLLQDYFCDEGRADRASHPEGAVLPAHSIGMKGFCAGPALHYVDIYALADPLLARTVRPRRYWRIGPRPRRSPRAERRGRAPSPTEAPGFTAVRGLRAPGLVAGALAFISLSRWGYRFLLSQNWPPGGSGMGGGGYPAQVTNRYNRAMPRVLVACMSLLTLCLMGVLAVRLTLSDPAARAAREPAPEHRQLPSRAPEEKAEADFLGVIIPSASVDIVPKAEGRLTSIEVEVGAHVVEGAPLLRLELQPLRKELAIAQAALQTARAQEQLAQVALSEARDRTQRYAHPKLVSLKVMPEEEIAAAGFQEKSAAAKLQSARAQVQEQVARVEQIQQRIEDSVIKAPFDGVVADRYLDPGAQASPSRPVLRLLGARGLRVRFAIPEDALHEVSPGAPVQVNLGQEGAVLTGQVENISPEVDAASRMIIALARLDRPPGPEVPAGKVVRVRVGPSTKRTALGPRGTP